jgi:hypothetical protein
MYSRRSRARSAWEKTLVSVAGSTSESQNGSPFRPSSICFAWLLPREVVMNSAQPLFLGQDRPQKRPDGRVGQRPFGEDDPGGRRADQAVVVVGADHLPDRAGLKADQYLVVAGVGPELVRKGLVDAAQARVRVDGVPDRLPGLRLLGQHVPVHCRPLVGSDGGAVQGDLVLAGAAMPDAERALAAVLKERPDRHLVGAGAPAICRQKNR